MASGVIFRGTSGQVGSLPKSLIVARPTYYMRKPCHVYDENGQQDQARRPFWHRAGSAREKRPNYSRIHRRWAVLSYVALMLSTHSDSVTDRLATWLDMTSRCHSGSIREEAV